MLTKAAAGNVAGQMLAHVAELRATAQPFIDDAEAEFNYSAFPGLSALGIEDEIAHARHTLTELTHGKMLLDATIELANAIYEQIQDVTSNGEDLQGDIESAMEILTQAIQILQNTEPDESGDPEESAAE